MVEEEIPGLSPVPLSFSANNLNPDPGFRNLAKWRATGDMALVVEDGAPALLVTENADGGSLYVDPTTNFSTIHGATVGRVLYLSFEVKVTTPLNVRTALSNYNGGSFGGVSPAAVKQDPADGWVRHWSARPIEAAPEGSYFRALIWPTNAGLPVGQGFYVRDFHVATLDPAVELPLPYFDGSTPDYSAPGSADAVSFSWDGVPWESSSRATSKGPGPWAREWWESLPLAYRVADRDEVGGYPLLRYMQGPGSVAQKVRALGQDFWDGVFTDPLRVPDGKPLRWLAMVLGLKVTGGDADLRARLVELVENGRSPDGTKGAIADATRPYLLGSRQVQVTPDPANPNQIIVFVRADEVPAQGLAWVAAQIQRLGIAPAGHQIILKAATSTWDKWTADVGATWDQVEVNIPTWAKSDAAGVVLE